MEEKEGTPDMENQGLQDDLSVDEEMEGDNTEIESPEEEEGGTGTIRFLYGRYGVP